MTANPKKATSCARLHSQKLIRSIKVNQTVIPSANTNIIKENYSDETKDECETMCQVILKMHEVVKVTF